MGKDADDRLKQVALLEPADDVNVAGFREAVTADVTAALEEYERDAKARARGYR